jgi:hypothetical protein
MRTKMQRFVARTFFLMGALIALIVYIGVSRRWEMPNEEVAEAGRLVGKFVREASPGRMVNTLTKNRVLFVIDPGDFGCPPCFDDLQTLEEELARRLGEEAAERGLFLVRQYSEGPWSDSVTVGRWASAQGFSFPVMMVPDSSFDQFALGKTSVLVTDETLRTIFLHRVPVGRSGRETIVSLLEP